MLRAVMVASILATGCLWENPGFGGSGGTTASGTTGPTTGAGTTGEPGTGSATGTTAAADPSGSGGGTMEATGSTGGGTTGGGTTGGAVDVGCPDHPSLLACYLFSDEPAGVLGDKTGNMLDFSMDQVALVEGLPGRGTAGQFTAASVVKSGERPAFDLDRFTISMLVQPTGGDGQIFDNDLQYGLRIMGGEVLCTVVLEPADVITVQASIPGGVWSHVFCSYDGQRLALYVGSATGSEQVSGTLKKDATNGVVIGNENPKFDFPFVGLIDHLLVFDAALPDEDRCLFDPFPCP